MIPGQTRIYWNKFFRVMTSKRQILIDVVSIIERELIPQSSEKNNFCYTWPLRNGFSGWLALNTIMGRRDDLVGINPIVGVVSEDIESLMQKLDLRAREGSVPTISISLGYLMPEKRYLEWLFGPRPVSELEPEVQDLMSAVRAFGMPFIESHASLPLLAADLEALRFTLKESVVYRLPIAYLLLGKSTQARQYAQQQLSALGERADDAANQYRQFARAFFDHPLLVRTCR
jgi:hypothetical protein